MGKFKVGDKALVEVAIVGEDRQTNEYQLKPIANRGTFWAAEDKIHQFIAKGENVPTKTYEDGLNDAWELFKIIFIEDYGLTAEEMIRIFDTTSVNKILRENTPQEAIEKIKAWQDSKEIHVGDVVKDTTRAGDEIAVVTYIDAGQTCHVLWNDGSGGEFNKNDFVKTGSTIDIAGLLEQIGGQQDAKD